MEDNILKAVKADDALVDNIIWDQRVIQFFEHIELDETIAVKLNIIRKFLTRRWRRNVHKSFRKYLKTHYGEWMESKHHLDEASELSKDINAYIACIPAITSADWFEWPGTSSLFFWRW